MGPGCANTSKNLLPQGKLLPPLRVPPTHKGERPCFSLRKTPKKHRPPPRCLWTGHHRQQLPASRFAITGEKQTSVCLCHHHSLTPTASLTDLSRREPRGGKVHLRHQTGWLVLGSLLQTVNVSFPTYPYYFKARQLKLGQNQEVIQEFCSLAIFHLIAAPNKPAMTPSDPFLP